MLRRLRSPFIPAGLAIALTGALAVTGCGSGSRSGPRAHTATLVATPAACTAAALEVLEDVAMRVYREGVVSERTAAAAHMIAASRPLRDAVERGDAVAARAAVRALIATGHMTNLKIMRGSQVLADLGAPVALAPFGGTLTGRARTPIGTYLTSVWSGEGFILETDGITQGAVALRTGTRTVAGSLLLPPRPLPLRGTLTRHAVLYRYTSFPVKLYPSGAGTVYLLRTIGSTALLCGRTSEDVAVNTLSRVANLIYAGEAGPRALVEVRRVQHDEALLRAVARRDPAATRRAVQALLNRHIVRLRVSAGGALLADVGGPFVLAPVDGALHLGGRTIGTFVVSIQDDEGYKRLAGRLAGLDVLMYMGGALVKNSLGPNPGDVPAGGTYRFHGREYRVVTIHGAAFPSGPLTIRVLIPIPYT